MTQDPKYYQESHAAADGTRIVLTNYLFGEPLYGWYIFEVETFQPGEIEGTLMTVPIEIYGPLDTLSDANIMLTDLLSGHKTVDGR